MTDRAQRYLAKVPLPTEGDRNASLNRTGFMVLERFALDEGTFSRLLTDWIAPAGLGDAEVASTLASAWRAAQAAGIIGSKPFVPKVGGGAPTTTPRPAPIHRNGAATPQALPVGNYDLTFPTPLPDAIPNGAVRLLDALYEPDEGVRICKAIFNADGREIPEDAGLVLPAGKWIAKFAGKKGGPDACWMTSEKVRPGVYVQHNPTKGAKDADVTDFRYALLEFDNLPLTDQWTLYKESKVPCAAIISSGKKSIHAWVKVDAANRQEYGERVALLYAHFSPWKPDQVNKNPSRFSRLPDVTRMGGRQELLSLACGCSTWHEWIEHLTYASTSRPRRISELLGMDTAHDPGCVVGWRDGQTTRFLCRGKSAWLIGPSGVGKSSLITEFAIAWALGKPAFGVAPVRPLKSVLVQGENDDFDLAEMVQGIAAGHNLAEDAEAFRQIDANVLFQTVTTRIHQDFIDWLRALVLRERPDILWVDPLLSFAGIDVSKQDQCSQFLRTMLQPVLEETGCVLIGVHHTGKPRSSRDSKDWSPIDFAYAGLGSSELVNWARAVMVIRQIDEHRFELKFAKRGRRAGATHPSGEPTTTLFLEHAKSGIRWHHIAPPEEPASSETTKEGGRPSKSEAFARRPELRTLLLSIPEEGESAKNLGQRIVELSISLRDTLGLSTARGTLIHLLNDQGKLTFDPAQKVWRKGPKL